ncbi:MAG TPA: prephenate/arogenate dehydrogenase family protein, partial [Alphaproteobacteria bacterium]|nr:prephenate/arogenate dehydrogenase family protein [Alphaproteobacteria bacterium]
MFEQVTLIGLGLIGSSIAHGLREKGLAKTIRALDKSASVREDVRALSLADLVTDDPEEAVKGSDLVIACVPVGAFESVARSIAPYLKPGAIVSDTGSVKRSVIDQMTPHLPPSVHFVPAHPVAGTEHSGPRAGFASLFAGRWCILTPPPGTDPAAVEKLAALWRALGAKVETMTPEHHDMALGITSHLPHLIAYTIVGTAADLETHTRNDVIRFSASGFRDFTRIAASDPVMWRDIFLHNRESVLSILQRFTEDLTALQRAIRDSNGAALEETFTRTRAIRREIIEAGQANYVYPGLRDSATP